MILDNIGKNLKSCIEGDTSLMLRAWGRSILSLQLKIWEAELKVSLTEATYCPY